MAVLCGIAFTMSLSVGRLALADTPDTPELMDQTTIGVVGDPLVSALLGASLMNRAFWARLVESVQEDRWIKAQL